MGSLATGGGQASTATVGASVATTGASVGGTLVAGGGGGTSVGGATVTAGPPQAVNAIDAITTRHTKYNHFCFIFSSSFEILKINLLFLNRCFSGITSLK
jgi:hypothetical protein